MEKRISLLALLASGILKRDLKKSKRKHQTLDRCEQRLQRIETVQASHSFSEVAMTTGGPRDRWSAQRRAPLRQPWDV